MNNFLYAVLVLVIFISNPLLASEPVELSIDSSTCWLKERGVAVKEGAISIQGKKSQNGCLAFITDEVFNKRYQFCAYSGFEMGSAEKAGYYGCSYSREKESYMFRAYMSHEGLDRKPEVTCKFMCYSK